MAEALSPQPAPTAPGWYWGRYHQRNHSQPFPLRPWHVVEIVPGMSTPVVMDDTGVKVYAVVIEWFGPVQIPEVQS